MSEPNTQPNTTLGASAREASKGKARGRISGGVMLVVGKVTRKLVWVFSGLIFAGIFAWGLVEIGLNGPSVKLAFIGRTGNFTFDRFLLFAGILSLIPPSIMYFIDSRRRDSIDNNIPHLIRDIADAGRSGMTLTRAIEISAERDYGPLTKEIKRLIAKISFRVPLERALQYFADSTGTMLSRRSAMLISEANKSGGDIQESMESVAKHVQDIQYLERKRRATLRPFIGVMYISFAVFLVTVYLLISSFFTQLANTNFGGAGASVGGVGFNFVSLPLDKITAVFLYMAMIEAAFAGLVGGKMATGYIRDGLKHAVLLMLICFIVFVFLI
ncbi:type II secretion system F family protein [Candidatus Bathyarchaeota archaeon]|nr:MAG: type II secretion system F family protein [Candidatus Bathyarchaeota archaeon]TMI29490.1 MAG: type II secretion system F family protein [Candidatus Bathyarchaeota archaeon]